MARLPKSTGPVGEPGPLTATSGSATLLSRDPRSARTDMKSTLRAGLGRGLWAGANRGLTALAGEGYDYPLPEGEMEGSAQGKESMQGYTLQLPLVPGGLHSPRSFPLPLGWSLSTVRSKKGHGSAKTHFSLLS